MKNFLGNSRLRELISILIVCFAIFFTSRALFHDGYFRTIDDISPVRIDHLARELKRGEWMSNFPVRYGAELSHKYGYFVYLFYAPLVYYAGAVVMLLSGVGSVMATKFVYVFPLLIGPLLFYWAMRQKLSRLPALTATIIYAFFPFRGFDTYIRGGVGEAWAMAFFPAIIGSLFLFDTKSKWAKTIFTLFLSLAIISHNISGLLIFGTVLLYGLIFLRHNKRYWFSLILSLGITAFFWLPSVAYTSIVKVASTVDHNGLVTNYLEPLSKLLGPNLNYDIQAKTSPLIAYILIFSSIVGVVVCKSAKALKHELWFFLGLGCMLYFLLSSESIIFWSLTLPLSRNLQFPWRLLFLLSTIIPLSLGLAIQSIKNIWILISVFALSLTLGAYFMVAFRPIEYSYYYNYIAEDTGPCATSWGEEYLPIWVKHCQTMPPDSPLKLPDDSHISVLSDSLLDTRIDMESATGGFAEASRYYFPGWRISIDGVDQPTEYRYSDNGIFRTTISSGNHEVRLYYAKTAIMWLADILTMASLAIFLGVALHDLKQK